MSSPEQMDGADVAVERDAFAERMLRSLSGLFDMTTIVIGDRLGLYRTLATEGALSPPELAARTGTNERYVREWLEQQTVAGILAVDDATRDAKARRFRLPAGHAEVLVERDSLDYMAPIARLGVAATGPLEAVLEAFRSGGGVAYADYGRELREAQGDVNRATFLQLIGTEWLPTLSDVHTRLGADPPARVADVGCGAGWSSIAIAQSYPNARVDGFDLDPPSVELARTNAQEAGLGKERVRFDVRDAGDSEHAGRYDLVTAFECIHDLSQPVQALRAMRSLLRDGGVGLVVDERVRDAFAAEGDQVEGIMYGWSVLHCLPVGMADRPSAETGTVMRADTLRRYATDAGFRSVEILPIDNLFFRLYRLDP
jgi:2-polyprenyl-3-methyl-5-hydroxy-6-metoxy-1,4-benzoquinol methylase